MGEMAKLEDAARLLERVAQQLEDLAVAANEAHEADPANTELEMQDRTLSSAAGHASSALILVDRALARASRS